MKKFLKFVLIFLLVIAIIIISILLYIGLIPGVAKPVDLGIKYDPALATTFNTSHGMKSEIQGETIPAGRLAEFSGQTNLNADLSSEEVTSVLGDWKRRSPSFPIRNVQVRFNTDGTGEISGILEIKTAITVAKMLGYNDSDIETGKKYVQYTFGDLMFYSKGTGNVINNQVTLNPSNLKIGNVSVPSSITSQVTPVVVDAIEKRLNQVSSINVRSMTVKDGKLHFDGTLPYTVK